MEKSNKTIIGIVLIALVVLTGIYFLFIKKDKKEDKDEGKGEGKGEVSEEDKEAARLKAEAEEARLKEQQEAEEARRLLDEAARKKLPITRNDLITVGCVASMRTKEIDVVKNDKYNGSFVIEIIAPPTKGNAEVTDGNKVKYTLNTGIRQGVDVIKYRISDDDGESNEASIVIKIQCQDYCFQLNNIKHRLPFSESNISYSRVSSGALPLQDIIRIMERKQWSLDMISYGAAFLKGIDSVLSVDMLEAYTDEINRFMSDCKGGKTKDIVRRPDLADEINGQIYSVGILPC